MNYTKPLFLSCAALTEDFTTSSEMKKQLLELLAGLLNLNITRNWENLHPEARGFIHENITSIALNAPPGIGYVAIASTPYSHATTPPHTTPHNSAQHYTTPTPQHLHTTPRHNSTHPYVSL